MAGTTAKLVLLLLGTYKLWLKRSRWYRPRKMSNKLSSSSLLSISNIKMCYEYNDHSTAKTGFKYHNDLFIDRHLGTESAEKNEIASFNVRVNKLYESRWLWLYCMRTNNLLYNLVSGNNPHESVYHISLVFSLQYYRLNIRPSSIKFHILNTFHQIPL